MMIGLPARTQRPGDLVVARRASLPAVHDQHEQVGRLDRPLPRSSTSACSGSSLTPNMPPVSVSRKSVRFQLTGCEITSRVVPGTGVTMARRDAVIRLNSVDLPTFGRPTSTTTGLARVCTFRLWLIGGPGRRPPWRGNGLDSVSLSTYDG